MENQETNPILLPGAIVVAGALVALAVYFGGTPSGQVADLDNSANQDVEILPVSEEDHLLGSRDAEIVIIEYSDTECPFCKTFHNTMKEVMNTYQGKVAWVFRHFPIQSLHQRAKKEAEATECVAELAGEQAFWTYLDKIFTLTNSNDSLDPNLLPTIAGEMGIDTSAFNTCLTSGRYTAKIEASIAEAVKAGARGTPYPIIMNVKTGEQIILRGAEPLTSVKEHIDSLL
jgi:protein-disulfide isomerase